MENIKNFEGDILLYETDNGGEVAVEKGVFLSDGKFSTAVYLSLFGGNKDDSGKVKNSKQWWGNMLDNLDESEKLRSRFQHIITGLPMTVKNIREAETAAVMDLKWFVDEKIADKINVYGKAVEKNRFSLSVEIMKDMSTLFSNVYFLRWGGAAQ